MTNSRTTIYLFLALMSLTLLSGCGARQKSVKPSGASTTDLSSTALSECNSFKFPTSLVEGSVASFYDQSIPRNDLIQLRISKNGSTLSANGSIDLKFYKWKSTSASGKDQDTAPVALGFYSYAKQAYLNSTATVTTLNLATINQLIQTNSLGSNGVTASNFFDKQIVILTGIDLQWDVVQAVETNSASSNAVIDSTEFLIPAFAADPNSYTRTHQSTWLQQLHPFYSLMSSGMTGDQFKTESAELCSGFDGLN